MHEYMCACSVMKSSLNLNFDLFCMYSFHLIDYWYMYYNFNDLNFCYRDQERKVGPDGFLDSNRYSHSFLLKKDATGRRRAASVAGQPSVVSLTSRIHQDKKDYDRRIKVIEVHKICLHAASSLIEKEIFV